MSTDAKSPDGPPTLAPAEPVVRQALAAAVGYAMVMLVATWVLGPIREFFVRAGADPLMASLSQGVALLLILTQASGWAVRTFDVPGRLSLRLAVGLGAVVLFAACDAASALLLFGLSPRDLTAELIGPQGPVIMLTMVVAAILPAVRSRSNGA